MVSCFVKMESKLIILSLGWPNGCRLNLRLGRQLRNGVNRANCVGLFAKYFELRAYWAESGAKEF